MAATFRARLRQEEARLAQARKAARVVGPVMVEQAIVNQMVGAGWLPSLSAGRGHAAIALVTVPGGIVCVLDPHKANPVWKLPGGKGEPGETAAKTASRELEGETGILLPPDQLGKPVRVVRKDDHDLFYFWRDLLWTPKVKEVGHEDELVRIIPIEEVMAMRDFHFTHREFVADTLAIPMQRIPRYVC